MRAEPAILEVKLNHRFANPDLLRRALTHSSLAYEIRCAGGIPLGDNEQLEFLGDSVLGFVVSDVLVQRFPGHREGDLSILKAQLVSGAHLHGVARRLELGSFLEIGRSEELSGGRSKKNFLVDSLEAIIAAIYLDAGLEPARRFIVEQVMDLPVAIDPEADTDIQPAVSNFKSALKDLAKARNLAEPRYNVIAEQGPAHARIFTVEVRVGREAKSQADGRSKKLASHRAARGAYEKLVATGDAPTA